ncbi:MAG: AraC family transcriptional regulator [Pigmentiphaga sp.]|nr:AraC family transcriptional regulator [Pigmentiphaga sp.]
MSGLYRSAAYRSAATMGEMFGALQGGSDVSAASRIHNHHGFAVRLPVAEGPVAGSWELAEFFGKGYVAVSDCRFAQARTEHVPGDDVIELHFSLTGPASVLSRAGRTEASDLSVVICRVGQDASYAVTCPPGRRRAVSLFVKRDFFLRLIDDGSAELAQVRTELTTLSRHDIYLCRLALNREMLVLAEQIMANPHLGERRLAYLEAKSTELLCETIGTWQQAQDNAVSRLWLRPRDLALIERAAARITGDLAKAWTIRQLAADIGTNTSKLTLGFRVLYGLTVQQYTLKARMARALLMLVEERRTVGETALAVGYQHQSSFSLAFTRYFGFAPSQAGRLEPEEAPAALSWQPGRAGAMHEGAIAFPSGRSWHD